MVFLTSDYVYMIEDLPFISLTILFSRSQCKHMTRKFLLASVLALNLSFTYPSCQKCFSPIILGSKRSSCPKCGSTGEVENITYRYKLSLKVAESNYLSLLCLGAAQMHFFVLLPLICTGTFRILIKFQKYYIVIQYRTC